MRPVETGKKWTAQEISTLLLVYPDALWQDILSALPERSESGISQKAKKLKLRRKNPYDLRNTKMQERSRKISTGWKPENHPTSFQKGQTSPNKGKHLSLKTRALISATKKLRNALVPPRHHSAETLHPAYGPGED